MNQIAFILCWSSHVCLSTLQVMAMQSAELQLATSGEGAAAVVGIWEGGSWEVAWDYHVSGAASLLC